MENRERWEGRGQEGKRTGYVRIGMPWDWQLKLFFFFLSNLKLQRHLPSPVNHSCHHLGSG